MVVRGRAVSETPFERRKRSQLMEISTMHAFIYNHTTAKLRITRYSYTDTQLPAIPLQNDRIEKLPLSQPILPTSPLKQKHPYYTSHSSHSQTTWSPPPHSRSSPVPSPTPSQSPYKHSSHSPPTRDSRKHTPSRRHTTTERCSCGPRGAPRRCVCGRRCARGPG